VAERYVVVPRGAMTLSQAEAEVRLAGGRNIRTLGSVKQIFCDLDPEGLKKLSRIPNLKIDVVKKISPAQVALTYSGSQATWSARFHEIRAAFTPPITGQGYTIAILDSGIRKTHISLRDKVIYEKNFTTSPTADDIYSHGTAVAFMAAGGIHAPGVEAGIAPGAKLMNIKVLDDTGYGTVETLISGLEECVSLRKEARTKLLPRSDPMYLNSINMSLGLPDDGDPENPVRLAIEETYKEILGLFASAGNEGPAPRTITLPAAASQVWAVGAVTFTPFDVWERSSRGPTLLEEIKPELVFYGVDIVLPSAAGDEDWGRKSGTSFSCPLATGGFGLISEWGWRYLTPQQQERFAAFGKPEWEAFMMPCCVKAPGNPVGKDNNWGYGMPMGHLALRQIQAPDITRLIAPVLGLGIAGMALSTVAREMKRVW